MKAQMGTRGGMSQSLDGVQVVPFFYKLQINTDGTVNWQYIDLELSTVRTWGPHLTELVAHTMTENHLANLEWKVVFYWSVDNLHWEGPEDITGVITSTSSRSEIHTAYNDKSTLGLNMRYAIAVRNAAGQGGPILNATVTCACAFDFRR